MRNSTIAIKKKNCRSCGRMDYIFSRGRCKNCSRIEDAHKKEEIKVKQEGLSDLIEDLDTLVSKWVRYSSDRDDAGLVKCYTCNDYWEPSKLDAGHYITRACMQLRFDVSRNIRPQCPTCNRSKYGTADAFADNLELEMPGVTDILLEESRIIYRFSRDELRGLIAEFTHKVKKLK